MRVGVGVLTYNQIEFGREEMFDRTIDSLYRTELDFDLFALDNHSTDGTTEKIKSLPYGAWSNAPRNTPGFGKNLLVEILMLQRNVDLIVLSDDDILWKPYWLEDLHNFWHEAPKEVKIIGCLYEDEYKWNEIFGSCRYPSGVVLNRASTSGNSWSFKARDHALLKMESEKVGVSDVPVCKRLVKDGYMIWQVDLATNLGKGKSTWGNNAAKSSGERS